MQHILPGMAAEWRVTKNEWEPGLTTWNSV